MNKKTLELNSPQMKNSFKVLKNRKDESWWKEESVNLKIDPWK